MQRFLTALWITLKITLLAALLFWLAMQPGTVDIKWHGYDITIRFGVAAIILVAGLLLFGWLFHVWRRLVALPGSFRQQRQWHKLQNGYQAVERGLLALYLQNYSQATRQAKEAIHLLPRHGLTHYLAAEAARRQGDLVTAQNHYHALQQTDDGEALGIYGQLSLALQREDKIQSVLYARQLLHKTGLNPYTVDTLTTLEIEQGNLTEAEKILRQAIAAKIGDQTSLRSKLAEVLLALSERALKQQDYNAALECAREALKWHPGSVDAAQQTALLWQQRAYKRRAEKTILNTYEVNPHPGLVQVWLQIHGAEKAIDQIALVERLTRENPDSPVSHIAMAEANRKAGLWGVARKHAMRAEEIAPGKQIYQLLAEIERGDSNDPAKIRHWQSLADQF
ncbi:MAG TPA: heme biosynthesis HemY N-terminal domain-containing protein [Alphaproteobacteria bacterium]